MAEKAKLVRTDWSSSFSITGKPRLGDTSFKIDAQSNKSNYMYNSMRFPVDCGEKHGTIWVELMGGYNPDNPYPIYCFTKDNERLEVDWEDRNDEELLDTIVDSQFITVGLERKTDGTIYREKFLSAYDAIKYINKNLRSDMMVNVGGKIEYSFYNDNVTIKKIVNRIVLIKDQESAEPSANFTQSILVDKDSVGKDSYDKDKGVMYVDARVLDYVKEINGTEIKGQYPFNVQFEFPCPEDDMERRKKIIARFLKPKKGINQITFKGEFVESGASVKPSRDDLSDDIKGLIDMGLYTEEEALAKCATTGSTERRMILIKPDFKVVGEEDNTTQVLREIEGVYTEEDLTFDISSDDELPFDADENTTSSDVDDLMNWLDV